MDLKNEFTVDAPIERAWAVLTDVETIAPCLPGAQLQEIEGDEYRGIVKVKVGPITAQYKGKATFVEQDQAAGRVVLKGEGRDTKGQGNASALITAQLTAISPTRTLVTVETDLTVTGKVAQFGRGVMADVSGKLMDQFAKNLSAKVLSPSGSAAAVASAPTATPASASPTAAAAKPTASEKIVEAAPAASVAAPSVSSPSVAGTSTASPTVAASQPTTAASPGVRKLNLPDPEPIDLMDAAGGSVVKRAIPAAILLTILAIIIRSLRGK